VTPGEQDNRPTRLRALQSGDSLLLFSTPWVDLDPAVESWSPSDDLSGAWLPLPRCGCISAAGSFPNAGQNPSDLLAPVNCERQCMAEFGQVLQQFFLLVSS